MRQIQKDSTDKSVDLYIIDDVDGTPETGVVFDTSGIDLKYRREGELVVSVTEIDLTSPALDDAHEDGGFLAIGNGSYRFDLPDDAFATGADKVTIFGTVTGMIVLPTEVQLVAFNPEDVVRLGLTALPNAAADAAGGLPVSILGSLDMDAMNTAAVRLTAVRAAVLTDWIDAGRLDVLLDALIVVVDAIATSTDTDIPALIAALNDLSASSVNAEIVDALNVDTYAEPGQGVAPATASLATKINFLYKNWHNLKRQTGTVWELWNNAGDTVDQKATVSNDGVTAVKEEILSGP